MNGLDWLSNFGADPDGGITRLLYSSSWIRAQQALAERMKEAGLSVYYDDAGNLYGRLVGTEKPDEVVLTGSHIDTVRSGGKYDGAYGIVAGLTALQNLREVHGMPKRTLEVVSICEEEGSRFPVTFWGSGNITGRWSMTRIPDVTDDEGMSLLEAMQLAGFGPGKHKPCLRHDLHAFVELHIEQGSILERSGLSLGIVQGIVGQARLIFEVCGEANHAGTTSMGWRRDALAGTAEMTIELEKVALTAGEPYVATVGKIDASPNTSNVIPGHVLFTVDLRHPEPSSLEEFSRRVVALFYDIASRRGLSLSHRQWMFAEPVPMHSGLIERMEHICHKRQLGYQPIYSGAGHDAQMFRAVCHSAMLFVPSRGGISHSPLEFTPPEHLTAGVEVLGDLLYRLAYEE